MDYTNMPPNSPQVEPEPHESINAISTIDSYNLLVIALCSSTCNPHSLALPMLFHLLTCGHIVTIDHPDQRCARNCHHTLSTPLPPSPSAFQEPQYTDDKITLIAGGTEAHTDTLYCEVCTGIPFDKYYTMLPPTSTSFPRRCLALSRAIIAAATMLPAPAVEELLCPVLRSSQSRDASKMRSSRTVSPGSKTAEMGTLPKLWLKLRLNVGNKEEKTDPFPATANEQNTDYNSGLPQYPAGQLSVKTRTGRTVHKRQHEDVIQGSDYDQLMGLSSEGFDNDDFKFQPDFSSDLPNALSNAQGYSGVFSPEKRQKKRSLGRPRGKRPSFTSHLDKVSEEEDCPSSSTLAAQSSIEHTSFQPSQDVYDILNSLKASTKTHIDLPSLGNTNDPDTIQPYSAELLTHLYITCYHQNLWNLCDLITDTWIRAFHTRRKKATTDPTYTLWRPNKALSHRKRAAQRARLAGVLMPSEYDANPRNLGLDATDPDLDANTTDTQLHLVTLLYEHTPTACGARMLWADALALAGDQTEKEMEVARRRGVTVHPDLVWNVMQSGLRMVRRRLTMKCEESTEGAWCRRYHEHGRSGANGGRCYREVAAEEREEEEEEEGEE
ncbi:hypothetical protein BM1_06642 [Bipolaris maydis]|nr:hypothetical protein BM1_06642 [Bipolaris maydis]